MPDNKKHHYVPKFYLRRFSRNGKSLCLYNLPNQLKVDCANIKGQCYKDYFYGKEKDAEYALRDIENEANRIFGLIDELKSLPPNLHPDHVTLVIYIIIQYARTLYSAEVANELHDKLFKHAFGKKLKNELEKQGLEFSLDDVVIGIEDPARFVMQKYAAMYPLLLDMGYKLIVNNTNVEFVTSDNPVVLYNQLLSFRKAGNSTGLITKGLQIFFPISPRLLIVFYDMGAYRVSRNNKIEHDITDVRDVYNLNLLQACSCHENIYFMDEDIDTASLHKKARPHMRKDKSTLQVVGTKRNVKSKTEYIMFHAEEIRVNLDLSFMRVRRNAKRWRNTFRTLREQPALIVRNEALHEGYRDFRERVEANEYQLGDFLKYCLDKGLLRP